MGIEERTWQPDGTVIISTGFGLGGIDYELDVCCGSKKDKRGFSLNDLGYSSKSKIYFPIPHFVLKDMGPNLETKFMFNAQVNDTQHD